MANKILSDARNSKEDSILEKEEEEEEEEEDNENNDEKEDNNGEESENDTEEEEEDFETFFNKKESSESGSKLIENGSNDSNTKKRLNGYLPCDKDKGNAQTWNDNEDSNHDNDDDDNDERNRKMKKSNASSRKDTKDSSEDGKTALSLKPPVSQKPASFSEDSAIQKPPNAMGSHSQPRTASASSQATPVVGNPAPAERKKHPATNLKIMAQKSAAAKRRDYGLSLLLSNVPMSPKIVNGSFAALFDGEYVEGSCSSLDLSSLTRNWVGDMGGEFIRLSPRKRGKLSCNEKQLSLDYGVLSASQKTCPARMAVMGSLDSKIDDILELSTALKERKKEKQGVGRVGGGGGGERDGGNDLEDGKKSGFGVGGGGGGDGDFVVVEENGKDDGGGGGYWVDSGKALKLEGGMSERGVKVRGTRPDDAGEKIDEMGGGYQGKGGNPENGRGGGGGGQGSELGMDQRGNGTVVVEKENWDTGHVRGDVTTFSNDVTVGDGSGFSSNNGSRGGTQKDGGGGGGQGEKMRSVCPLCGRGAV